MNETTTTDRPALQDLQVEPAAETALAPATTPTEPARPRTTVVREAQQPQPRPQAPKLEVTRSIVEFSPECDQLFAAMAVAQGEFVDVERTQEAEVQSRRTNTKFTYEYETLADVIAATRKPLADSGLAVMQFPWAAGQNAVTVRTLVTHKSGQWLYNDLTAQTEGVDPQSLSSGITYLKRIARKSILGVAATNEDDDANSTYDQRPRGPQPAKRMSDEAGQEAKPHSAPPPPPAKTEQHTGPIVEVKEQNGATTVRLGNGFRAATRDAKLVHDLKTFSAIQNAKVTLTVRPSAKDGFMGTITDVALANGSN